MMPNSGLQNPITAIKTTIPAPNALAGYTATAGVGSAAITIGGAPVDTIYGNAVRLLVREGNIKKGDYIYDAAQDEFREIVGMSYSGETINIASPFTGALAGIALVIVPRSDFTEISFVSATGITVIRDAFGNIANLIEGQSVDWDKEMKNRGENGFVGPFIIDTTAPSILSFQFSR